MFVQANFWRTNSKTGDRNLHFEQQRIQYGEMLGKKHYIILYLLNTTSTHSLRKATRSYHSKGNRGWPYQK